MIQRNVSMIFAYNVLFLILFSMPSFAWGSSSCGPYLADAYNSYLEFINHENLESPYHDQNIPVVNFAEVQERKSIDNKRGFEGINHLDLIVGKLNGKNIFIKFFHPQDTSANEINEVKFTKLISDLGFGPKFYGVIKKDNKTIGIVTDFIDNAYSTKHTILSGIRSEKSKTIQSFLGSLGIDPRDLQYRIDRAQRLWVVDPGRFVFYPPESIYTPQKAISRDAFEAALKPLQLPAQ